MAAKKPESTEYREFHQRFITLIDLKGKKFWLENLGARANLIWGWHQGNVPSIDYILKVCELSGVSANWLFLGQGPQFMKTEAHTSLKGSDRPFKDDERETLQEQFYLNDQKRKIEKKEALKEMESIKKDAEITKLLKWLKDIFGPEIQKTEDINLIDVISKIVMPILSFIKTHGEIMIPMIELYAKSKEAEKLLNQFMKFVEKVKEISSE